MLANSRVLRRVTCAVGDVEAGGTAVLGSLVLNSVDGLPHNAPDPEVEAAGDAVHKSEPCRGAVVADNDLASYRC